MSYQQHPTPVSQWAKFCALLIAALAVVATSFAAIAASQPATAQIAPLDPALCATTYKPTSDAGTRTEEDCRTMVAWRNAVVNHPHSVIGTNHFLRQWGTGSQTKFNNWHHLAFTTVNGQRVIDTLWLSAKGLGGPLPGVLPDVRRINMDKNLLSGGLPTWIYGAQKLEYLDLRNNRLSGTITGSAFNTPKLVNFLVQHNRFSGQVPNFNFARMPKLTDLRLSNNNFSGDFPSSWSGLNDGRGMQRLQVASNSITGNLPSWAANLKMANSFTPWWIGVGPRKTYYVDFRNNRLCIPSNFPRPNYKKLDGSDATVQAFFGSNACVTGQPASPLNAPPAENAQFETVDASGNPTSDNPVRLKVTWSRPSGAIGALTYKVKLHLIIRPQDNVQENREWRYDYCPPDEFKDMKVGPTSAATGELIISRSNCTESDIRTLFDPTKYTASVSTEIISGGTEISGDSATSNAWGVYIADDAQKTYRNVADTMGLGIQQNIWLWDAVNQVWRERNQDRQDFASLNLEPGQALAMQRRAPASWLPLAGLSTADADTPVTLQNGWNLLSAGGSVSRGVNEDGAFFIDDSLIDCSSAQGAIAILRHVPNSERFDIELPCHPSREAAITRGQAFRPIQEISEVDTLFVYFRSALPVAVIWDSTNNKYIPAR